MIIIGLIAFVIGLLIINSTFSHQSTKTLTYSRLLQVAKTKNGVLSATINNNSGVITGQLSDGTNFTANGPLPVFAQEATTLKNDNVSVTFANPSSLLGEFLPYLIWILIFGGFIYYASRQARGQMNGMMSVGALAPNSSVKTTQRPPSRTWLVTSASNKRSVKSLSF